MTGADDAVAAAAMGLTRLPRRIAEKAADYRSGGPVLIVALGDSVTMGATAGGVLEPDAVYHHRLKRLLEARYPAAVFSVINAGIGGDTATAAQTRLERDVIRHQPDLVLIGFGLNDASDEPGRLEAFTEALRTMVRRVRGEAGSDVVLLTPSFMASRPNPAAASADPAVLELMMTRQNSGCLKRYAEAILALGQAEGVPVANVYGEWEALAQRGVDTTDMLANGLNHPTGEAHAIAAEEIFRTLVGR